jgi:D-xylose transport system permease protein
VTVSGTRLDKAAPTSVAQPAPARLGQSFGSAARAYSMVGALIMVWLAFEATTGGVFLNPRNFSNLMRQMAVTGVLSIGMLMVIVIGEIDLSVGSLVGLTGMVAALAQATYSLGLVPTLLSALLLGALIGTFQGSITAWGRVPSFIVTLGGLLAWRGVTKGVSSGATIPIQLPRFGAIGQWYLDKPVGIALVAIGVIAFIVADIRTHSARVRLGLATATPVRRMLSVGIPSVAGIAFVVVLNAYEGVPVPVVLFVAIALAGAFVMSNTTIGRYMYAAGGNREAARLSGINTRALTIGVFSAMGLLAGLAGIIYTARVGSASPDAGLLLELDAIAACVIGGASLMGGRGAVFGACMGALFMASLDNGMSLKNVPDFIQDIVKGGILVTAVALDMLGRKRNS